MKLAACIVLLAGLALADSIPFSNGSGAASGTFTFNTATNKVTSWNLVTTFIGSTATDVYNSADDPSTAAPTVIVLTNFSGNEVLSFEENNLSTNQRDELDIVIACNGVANCLTTGTTGSSFATTAGGTEPCGPPGTLCIQSSEQFGVPEVLNSRNLAAGFVTDPPVGNDLTFTLTSTPSTVPEPEGAWLLLSVLGGLGILGKKVRFYRSKILTKKTV
jgi:hypothetical protein